MALRVALTDTETGADYPLAFHVIPDGTVDLSKREAKFRVEVYVSRDLFRANKRRIAFRDFVVSGAEFDQYFGRPFRRQIERWLVETRPEYGAAVEDST